MESLITLREAAAILRLHPDTIKAYARLGRIGCVRLGLGRQGLRFREADIAAFIAARATAAVGAPVAIEDYEVGPGRPNQRGKNRRTA